MPEPENTAAGSVPASDNSPRLLEVSMPDESTSQVRIFEPRDHGYEGPLGTAESEIRKPLVVIWPGFGMGARYFDPMGRELASRGYHVASGELRGQGTSTARATRKHTWGYHHLASQDYPLTIRAVKQDLGLDADYPTVLLCHSLGGQLPGNWISQAMGVKPSTRCWNGVITLVQTSNAACSEKTVTTKMRSMR